MRRSPFQPKPQRRGRRESPRGWISRYAWGDDYHEFCGEKLKRLSPRCARNFPSRSKRAPTLTRVRDRARGREICGARLAREKYLPDQPAARLVAFSRRHSHDAGTCAVARSRAKRPPPIYAEVARGAWMRARREAFPQPYVLDARRCISYLTIELARHDSRRIARGNGKRGHRMRHLPGRLPVESQGTRDTSRRRFSRAGYLRAGGNGCRRPADGICHHAE